MNESKWEKTEFDWGHFYKFKNEYKNQDSYWFVGTQDDRGININRELLNIHENCKDFIIKYWEFKKGSTDHEPKAQRNSIEYNFIIEGKITGRIAETKLTLNQGDFVVIKPGFVINLQEEVLEYTKGITVKVPGIARDEIKKGDFN